MVSLAPLGTTMVPVTRSAVKASLHRKRVVRRRATMASTWRFPAQDRPHSAVPVGPTTITPHTNSPARHWPDGAGKVLRSMITDRRAPRAQQARQHPQAHSPRAPSCRRHPEQEPESRSEALREWRPPWAPPSLQVRQALHRAASQPTGRRAPRHRFRPSSPWTSASSRRTGPPQTARTPPQQDVSTRICTSWSFPSSNWTAVTPPQGSPCSRSTLSSCPLHQKL